MSKWYIEYDNDGNGGYSQWWDVTDGDTEFRAWNEEDAKWLCELLNEEAKDEISND